MSSTLVRLLALLGACATTGKPITISPDAENYCKYCSCDDRRSPPCPMMSETAVCTLSALVKELPLGPYVRCGDYVIFEKDDVDHSQTWVFSRASGGIVAWREEFGLTPSKCSGGFQSMWNTRPPGFRFPPTNSCQRADPFGGPP
jgi:hypothetical protein